MARRERPLHSSLIVSCAAIQPALQALDEALRPYNGSARKGIDDGVCHGPPEVIWPILEAYYERLRVESGLELNRIKTRVHSPSGKYVGKPDEFIIGSVKVIVPGGLDGAPTEVVAEGLAIWGAALSRETKLHQGLLGRKSSGGV